jgi:hypothetical protein
VNTCEDSRSLPVTRRHPVQTAWIALLLGVCSTLLPAQAQESLGELGPAPTQLNGFHLYGGTVSFGYAPGALARSFLPVNTNDFTDDYYASGSVSVGYSNRGPRGSFGLIFSPAYVGRVRQSELDAFFETLSLDVTRRLSSRWNLSFSAAGSDSRVDQLAFTQSQLIPTAGASTGTVQGNGSAAGPQPDPGLGLSNLGDSLGRTALYGRRVLGIDSHATLAYRFSPRTTVHFDADGRRSQNIRGDVPESLASSEQPLLSRSTMLEGGAGISYTLSPKTELGTQASYRRVESELSETAVTTAGVYAGRKLGRRWFSKVEGGAGYLEKRRGFQNGGPVAFNGSGTLGLALPSNTFSGTYRKSVGDVNGFGAQATEGIIATWRYHPRNAGWSLDLRGAREIYVASVAGDVRLWQAGAGLTRTLNRHLAVNLSYIYLDSEISVPGVVPTGYCARITLMWVPAGHIFGQ